MSLILTSKHKKARYYRASCKTHFMELSSFLLFFELTMQLISFKFAVLHHMWGRLK